jgi:hypothetical protein
MKFVEYLKSLPAKIKNGPVRKLVSLIVGIIVLIKTIFFSRYTILAFGIFFGFFFGARLSEVGALEGLFGKNLKGATVFLSGPCKVNGIPRLPALVEDEVKITGQEEGVLTGVLRKTREVVICDTKITSVDKIPALSNWKKAPAQVPALEAVKVDFKEPEWKKLVQKTLIVSGSCFAVNGKEIAAFTDEKVDVTDVKQALDKDQKEEVGNFVITGIKKSDKIAIVCKNTAIKYSTYEEHAEKPVEKTEPEKAKSFLGERLLITGRCFPDPRTPIYAGRSKVAFYPLVNALVQVNEEVLDSSGNPKKLVVAVLNKTDENRKPIFAVCDMAKIPFTYKPYDGESMKLDPITESVDSDGSIGNKVVPNTAPSGPAEPATPAKEVTPGTN